MKDEFHSYECFILGGLKNGKYQTIKNKEFY